MAVSWTCKACGLEYDSISPQDGVQALRSFPRRYREVIGPFLDDDEVLRRRPDPNTWSALEYTAHVADILQAMTPHLVQVVQKEDAPHGVAPQAAPAQLGRCVADGEAHLAGGRHQRVCLPDVQGPGRGPVIDADQGEGDADPEEAVVHQHVPGPAVGHPEEETAG